MPKNVAIVGGARSRRMAPYQDPSWDIWAFSSLRLRTPRITRWFEMHAMGDLKSQLQVNTQRRRSFRSYMEYMRRLDCPIYMQRTHEALPNSVTYPLQDALDAFGRCFTSTAAYLIALAILEEYETIGIWGIRLSVGSAYARQRPGVEYLLGVARERGIDVHLPPDCPLSVPSPPVLPPTDILYGYDWTSPKAWWRRTPRRRTRTRRRHR